MPPTPFETRAAYVEAAAGLLGLPLDPAWAAGVADNLAVLSAAAERVAAFPLPDEAEVAPVFEA
ncbi:DUF4089 domain-containing protein [Methylobacterium sp. Leaf108]|uniref:DUF4089 domain-containing protein n=1 Tax=Methylobacterium sp. Leaf108 TaxID=1736256 RepID=UPI0006FC60E2|nr:DUF4089 domain-containing protein [Methylobacterium sp. Leaf108]KQP50894.1 hypothetical protein ASF39_11695 [Methylobacterium sp. Leaf108]